MSRYALLLLLALFLQVIPAIGQSHLFRSYNVDKGLHQSQVTCIAQDEDGILYIGSQGGGISGFNGISFSPFFQKELGSAIVWDMIRASDNSMWIATDLGLFRVRGDQGIQKYTAEDGFSAEEVWSLLEDTEGNIWIGTMDKGLYLFNGKNFSHYGINDGLGFSSVNALGQDSNGKIWVGSFKYGVAVVENNKATNVTGISNMQAEEILDILISPSGELLMATEDGVKILENDLFVPFLDTLNGMRVVDLDYDKDGALWVATESEGLYIFDSLHIRHVYEGNGLETSYMSCIFRDDQDNIWVGTDGSGLAHFGGFTFSYYDKTNGLLSNQVLAIEKDRKGVVWLGTEHGLTKVHPDGSLTNLTSDQGLCHDLIHTIHEDRMGRVWLGFKEGVCYIEGDQIVSMPFMELKDVAVLSVMETSKGEMWIGSDVGLFLFRDDSLQRIYEKEIPEDPINKLFEDSQGRHWILMTDEIYLESNGKFSVIKPEDNSKDFFGITEDGYGNFYIAHQFGILVRRFDGSYDQLDTDNGLPDGIVYFAQYRYGWLWIGHQRGFDKVKLDQEAHLIEKRHYGAADGFLGMEANDHAIYFDDEEKLVWIGSVRGAYIYNKKYDSPSTTPPKILLKALRLLHGTVDWRTKYPDFKVKKGLPISPVFDMDDGHITFDFVGLDFMDPEGVVYQFMLEGYDSDWSPVTSQSSASYPYLPPGKYKFKVRAGNRFGVWSEEITYEFEIETPFWQRTWFYIIVIPLGLLLVYLIMLYRTRRLHRSKRKLEEIIRRRTLELNEYNKELSKLSLVASEIYDAVLICGADGNIQWYNKSFYQMAGFSTQEEFEKSSYGGAIHISELSSHDPMNGVLASFHHDSKPYKYDSFHITKSGEKKWTSGTLTPIYNEDKDLTNIIAIYTDITSRKQIEFELKKKNSELEQLSMIAQRMNEAVLITDEHGRIEYYNGGLVRNSGYSEEEFAKIIEEKPTIQDLSDNPKIHEIFDDFHTHSEAVFYDTMHHKKDGDEMWTTASLTPVFQDGILRNVIVVYTDITERRLIANQLRQTNKDITDSIKYAKQIQRAVLPDPDILHNVYPDSFVFYKPRDIVSGDFYWFSEVRGVLIMAAADCTGHGVPGAFMSMIGNEFLHQIVNNSQIDAPSQALTRLDEMITRALHQDASETVQTTMDGMDIALLAIHMESKFCQFSGAFNPMYLIRDGEIKEFEALKESIGGGGRGNKEFFSHEFKLETDDVIYLFSDGYLDQFGGEKDKKFTRKRFKQLLLDTYQMPLPEQKQVMRDRLYEWMGDKNRQVDDILVIGLRIT